MPEHRALRTRERARAHELAAARAADVVVRFHGARGHGSAFPVERLLRDAAALRIYEGTTLIQSRRGSWRAA
ncbi:MAG TPA: acyl-CoA dehydrogenase family protein [Planctomycetota bacterium]|nr:acyl-CoA dehydrogenase family protein [Planctomycetota bacterium]